MSEGFIKIYRQLLEWEWYTDVNTKTLFLHCLLKANYKTKKYQKNTVKKGSFVTSLESLSKETGLTIQQTRTALNHLVSTGEITSKSTSRNRIITVVNYDKYQDINKEVNKKTTSKQQAKQQTANKQLTSNQQAANNSRRKKEVYISPTEIYIQEEEEKKRAAHAAEGGGLHEEIKQEKPDSGHFVTVAEIRQFAATVPGGNDYNACDFRRAFLNSGTMLPKNWKEVFVRFAAADSSLQDKFLRDVEGGAYRERWNED